MFSKRQINNNLLLQICYISKNDAEYFNPLQKLVPLMLSKLHTIRYETIVRGKAPMFTNMCLQICVTDMFVYKLKYLNIQT